MKFPGLPSYNGFIFNSIGLYLLALGIVFTVAYIVQLLMVPCRMCAALLSPCCPSSLPPPWRYVYREERGSTINLNI